VEADQRGRNHETGTAGGDEEVPAFFVPTSTLQSFRTDRATTLQHRSSHRTTSWQ
jgi:hypothetical protein